jgi:CheY-like chemotaxis protein
VGLDVPEHVIGDPTRLRQVLSNLLSNALKFTKAGEVVVTVERIAGVGKMARLKFAVRDTGIGMSPETLANIFEPFRQADSSTTRRYGGTGLGLTISRRLVELMGGHLVVTSEESRGSQFSFELFMPIVTEPAAPKAADLRGTRALVVDDSATNRRVITGMLGLEGVETDSTGDAKDALRKLREAQGRGQAFSVVVTDMQMPGMDGLELVRGIRDDEKIATTPVVMATSGNRTGDKQRLSELRIASLLQKPLSRREVTRAIHNALMGKLRVSPEQGQAIQTASRPLDVLIAEDNPINQEVARAMLTRRGHRVDVVQDGRAAVKAALAKDYDAILMDIQMPELDGLDASREIRTHRPAPRPRIVAFTANVLPGERERCLAGGMDGYLAKPFAAADLFAVLEADHADVPVSVAPSRTSKGLIDLDGLRADLRAAGIEESLPVLVRLFLRDGPVRIAAITAAAKKKNGSELAQSAHALKSAAGAVRATQLMTLLGTLERTAKAGDVLAAVGQVDAIVAEHSAVRDWLEAGAWSK